MGDVIGYGETDEDMEEIMSAVCVSVCECLICRERREAYEKAQKSKGESDD